MDGRGRRGVHFILATVTPGLGEGVRLAIVSWIERTYHRRRRQRALGKLTPVEERAEFPDFVQKMREGRTQATSGNWFFRGMRSAELYRLPDRFSTLF